MPKSCIIIPLYNDWPSAEKLIAEIDAVVKPWQEEVSVLIVDDGSLETIDDPSFLLKIAPNIKGMTLIRLACNQGHQRAIAVGLVYARKQGAFDSIFVMDSDGEDRPGHLNRLKDAVESFPDTIITADRAKRSEGWLFRFCYRCYRLLFFILTGDRVTFGNYCAIPAGLLDRLVYYPELWNNLTGCIKKSRLPTKGALCPRGKRYAGESKMTFVSLFLHGMGVISVFKEVALSRIIIISSIAFALSLGALFLWCTVSGYSAGAGTLLLTGLSLVLSLIVFICLLALLSALAGRATPITGPAYHSERYIGSVQQIK
jgi:glycosyltransferase involved in cell wall biosynthesis